jgi:chromosome segregation ATPase
MVRGKQVLQGADLTVTPEELSDMMARTFRETLESRREQYVYELIDKLTSIQKERDELELQFTQGETEAQISFGEFSTRNNNLRSEIDSLESELRTLERRIARKESACQERVREKEQELVSIIALAEEIQRSEQQLSHQLGDLRAAANKMKRGQTNLLRQARTVVTKRISECIETEVKRCQMEHSKRISQASAELSQANGEQRDLENQARAFVNVAAEVTGDSRLRLISVEEFPERVAQIRNAIEEAVESRREAAVRRLREDIARQFPGIDFGGVSAATAVKEYIRERIRAKEKECQEVLRKGELREQRLREKLDQALRRVQKLQGQATEDFRFLDEFERSKREWENQRRKLDAKMSALTSGHAAGD